MVCNVLACSLQLIVHFCELKDGEETYSICSGCDSWIKCDFSPAVTRCPVSALSGRRMLGRGFVTGWGFPEEDPEAVALRTVVVPSAATGGASLSQTL